MQDCYLTGRNYDQVKFWQEVCRNTTVLGTASGGYFLEKKLHTVPVPIHCEHGTQIDFNYCYQC